MTPTIDGPRPTTPANITAPRAYTPAVGKENFPATTTVYLIEKLPGSSDHWFPVGVVETKEAAVRYVDKKNCGSTLSGDFYKATEFNLETGL